jgi:adenylate cyclase
MTRKSAKRLHAVLTFVVAPVLVLLIVLAVRQSGRLFFLEAYAYDSMTASLQRPAAEASPVVIIGIDEADIRSWRQYPISDRRMNALLQRLLSGAPRTIGVDIYRDFPVPDREDPGAIQSDRAALIQTMLDHSEIAIVERVAIDADDDNYVLAPAEIKERGKQQVAATALTLDPDQVVRRELPYVLDPHSDSDEPIMNLGFLLAQKYLSADDIVPVPADEEATALRFGKALIERPKFPVGHYVNPEASERAGEVFQYPIDFRAPRDFQTWSFRDVMDPAFDVQRLKDKLVIIGVTTRSVKDFVATPFSKETYGFVAHGYVADQLIRWAMHGEAPPRFAGAKSAVAWVLFWSLAGAVTGGVSGMRSLLRMAVLLLLELTLCVIASYVLLSHGTIVPVVPALLCLVTSTGACLAYMSAVDRKEQRMVEQLMEMHISRPIAEQLMEQSEAFFEHGKLLPQRMVATVLFSDLMDFTPIAEKLDSTELMNWLNEFFDQMTAAVEECGGVVNKFNGDQVMALFGPPFIRESDQAIAEDARAAVRCAVLMRRSLAKMNQGWKQTGLPTPRMRIGIYTGPLVAGSLGGKKRIEYTVIGDTVNIASRLESTNKECMDDAVDGTRIIIGQTTCAALDLSFNTRPLEAWEVKGREHSVAVHAVLDYIAGEPASLTRDSS